MAKNFYMFFSCALCSGTHKVVVDRGDSVKKLVALDHGFVVLTESHLTYYEADGSPRDSVEVLRGARDLCLGGAPRFVSRPFSHLIAGLLLLAGSLQLGTSPLAVL
jgi:hypothetical protein